MIGGGANGIGVISSKRVPCVDESDAPNIVNVPLRGRGFGDADYYRVFERVILPLAQRLRPDVVLVSAGYDCARGDLLGCCDVTASGFRTLSRLALGLAGGATLLLLEGGYDVDSSSGHAPLVEGVCASIRGLAEGPLRSLDAVLLPAEQHGWRDRVKPETEAVLEEVVARLSLP